MSDYVGKLGFSREPVIGGPEEWILKMVDVKTFYLQQYRRAEALFEFMRIITFPNEECRAEFMLKWDRVKIELQLFRNTFNLESRDNPGWIKLKSAGLNFQNVLIPFLDVCHGLATLRDFFDKDVNLIAGGVQDLGI